MSTEKRFVTIAGAGSGYTPGILMAMLKHKEDFPIAQLTLYDIDHERNADMAIIVEYILKKENSNIKLVVTENPKIAFSGVDFIFSQIRAGGMKMREMDEKIPLKYGLVGQETCGLGGFAYGMRSMKSFLTMVGYIEMYAPSHAWILNYTNPESIIAESVRRKYPNIKIINACDQTIGIEETIAEAYGYDRKNWIPNYYGLNHFGWYHSIYDASQNKDVMPEILEKATKDGFPIHWFGGMNRMVKLFPQAIPNSYLENYLHGSKVVSKSNPTYTRANEIMDTRLKDIKIKVKEILESKNTHEVHYQTGVHGEYIVDIAISLLHNRNQRFMLIVPNHGAIRNFRHDAVVEIPCYVNARGVEPISLRFDIPDFHKGLMEVQVAAEKLLVDAFFEGSYEKALQAFTLNLTVPNADIAKEVLDEMIEVNGDQWVKLTQDHEEEDGHSYY